MNEWNVPDPKKVAAYLKAEREFKKTFEEKKYGRVMEVQHMARKYSPIVRPLLEPLREISSKITSPKEHTPPLPVSQMEIMTFKHALDDKNGKLDNDFGIRPFKNGYYIGCKEIDIQHGELIFEDGITYELTPGLWELVTKKNPTGYTTEDLESYGEIIRDTFVYKQRNMPDSEKVKIGKGPKYVEIIKPIMYKYNLFPGKKLGEGLRKLVNNKNIEYVYWNSLDELLERLYILYGELKAGNTNPTIRNEIINILQEFKEL